MTLNLDDLNYANDPRTIARITRKVRYDITATTRPGQSVLTTDDPDLIDALSQRLDREKHSDSYTIEQVGETLDRYGEPEPETFMRVFGLTNQNCICPMCEGNGKVVNPSIDCGGISQEAFDNDPDFAEAYFSGAFDVTCPECDGLRVVVKLSEHSELCRIVKRVIDKLEYDRYAEARYEANSWAMGY